MATNDFKTVLVKDDIIGSLTDSISYQVYKGPQSINNVSYNAVSSSPSQIVYNVQVPSLETIIDRHVMITSEITFTVTDALLGSGLPSREANAYVVYPSLTDALSAFPMNQLIQNASVTINNNTVSSQVADVLQLILRCSDPKELAMYSGLCPTATDYLYSYKDAIISVPLLVGIQTGAGGVTAALDNAGGRHYLSLPNNVLGSEITRQVDNNFSKGRGTYMFPKNTTTGNIISDIDNSCQFTIRTTEPLFISPFTWGNQQSTGGIYGVANLNIILNLGNQNRMFRYADMNSQTLKIVNITSITSTLKLQLVTAHPSDLLSSRNITPYYELPLYKSIIPTAIPRGFDPAILTIADKFTYASTTVTSQSLQLSCIPDKIFIFIRKTNLTSKDSDTYFPIRKLSISFNNSSGILSSCTQEQLYNYSVEAGLINQTWDQFTGETICPRSTPGIGFPQVNGFTMRESLQKASTTGGIVGLNFGQHINLIEDYYAPSSLGSFNLQVIVDFYNHTSDNILANGCELVIVTMNSGILSCERGTSSIYTGLLTKSQVLDASSQESYTQGEVHRMIGGGSMFDNLKSGMNWITKRLPQLKQFLIHNKDLHPSLDTSAKVLGSLGYGKLDKRIMM